jgi:hypothetical protein
LGRDRCGWPGAGPGAGWRVPSGCEHLGDPIAALGKGRATRGVRAWSAAASPDPPWRFSARAAAERALDRLRMPWPGESGAAPMTVGQWLERWLAVRTAPRPSTLRSYSAHARLYLAPFLGQILLADLSAGHVRMFAAISRQHAAAGRVVSPATLARVRATLRAALNAAIRSGYNSANPASWVELPPARRPRLVMWTAARVTEWQRTGVRPPVAVWTPAHTALFLNSVRGHRLRAVFHLVALRGLRRGEACGPRWCDVDLDAATAVISWQLQ